MPLPVTKRQAPRLFAGRYELLDVLGRGGMGVVYRARDRLYGEVALKQLRLPETPRPALERAPNDGFASTIPQSYESSLAAPDAATRSLPIRPSLTLIREFQTLATLRHPHIIEVFDYGFDAEGQPFYTMPIQRNAEPITVAAAAAPFETKVGLLAQLLRATRYLHRSGILHGDLKPTNVLVVRGQVKVLDFGLSVLFSETERLGVRGTPHYIAPELFAGVPASRASDLFAIGVIALELMTGRRDASPTEVDERVAPIVRALLQPDWRERPHDAGEIIAQLASAAELAMPVESWETRESHLRAAPLVGRARELAQLASFLDELEQGRGGNCLLVGESGVGKSRLLAELRARALVRGIRVVRGQAVREGGGTHQLWRDVLRRMSLVIELDDAQAGALLPLVPDLPTLLGRDVSALPDVAPEIWHGRLDQTFDAMLLAHREPLLLLLEDLQWAGSESLKLLRKAIARSAELGIVVVGTFRDDEGIGMSPELAKMNPLPLERLRPDATAQLIDFMLGPDASAPRLIAELQQETEGNPFFLIELVRAMGDRADADGRDDVPTRRLPQGLREVVRRRLGQAPAWAQPLLAVAAISGRQFDLRLLAALHPEVELSEWVAACTAAAVLDIDDAGHPRFAHDKLREELLTSLEPIETLRLHRALAAAMERIGSDAFAPAMLAHHFRLAGDPERAAHYAGIAGEQALQSSAYLEAVDLLRQALMLSSAATTLTRARWMGQIAAALGSLGLQIESGSWASSALRELGDVVPSGSIGLTLAIARELGRACERTLFGQRGDALHGERRQIAEESLRIQNQLGETYFYREQVLSLLWYVLRAVNLGEQLGPSLDLARVYSALGVIVMSAGFHRLARGWLTHGTTMAATFPRRAEHAMTVHREALHYLVRAEWRSFEARIEKARVFAEQATDRRQWHESTIVRGLGHAYRGRFLDAAEGLALAHQAARANADEQSLIWSAMLGAGCHVRLEQLDTASALLTLAAARIDGRSPTGDRVNLHGAAALLALRLDDRRGATVAVQQVVELLQRRFVPVYWMHHALSATAETVLALFETEDDPIARHELRPMVLGACQVLRRFGRLYPVASASSVLWNGLGRLLVGDRARGQRSLAKAIRVGDELGLVYEAARARFELGRSLPLRLGRRHLEDAARTFDTLHLPVEHGRARQLLLA